MALLYFTLGSHLSSIPSPGGLDRADLVEAEQALHDGDGQDEPEGGE